MDDCTCKIITINILCCLFATGCILFGLISVPHLKHLLEEERHHIGTTCCLIYTNMTGEMDCTYNDENNSRKKNSFQCLRVVVSYVDLNSSFILAEMFRSYQDAMETDFGCSAYNCADPSKIFEYFREVNEAKRFQCFYHPDRLEYVYFNTANHSLVIFRFVLCLLFILIPPALLGYCCILRKRKNKLQRCRNTSCWKIRGNFGRWRSSTINSRDDKISRYLKNGSYRNCKRLIKEINANKDFLIDGIKLSPLGVATKYGYINIMDYLVSIGANMNWVQKREKRGIFHLACDSENEDSIKWCLDKKLPINQIDSAHQTPLVTYLENVDTPSLPLLKKMIDAGANVNTKDIKNLTPLHIACGNHENHNTETSNEVIALLVKSGCISHTAIWSTNNPADQWTPITSLLRQKEYSLCTLLIEAGYQLAKDDALAYVYLTEVSPDMQTTLREEVRNPSSLLRMCRFGIRNIFQGIRVQQNLELLPLPRILIQTLKLEEHYSNTSSENETFV